MSQKYAIGVDFGGTNLRVALVSEGGKIIRKVKRPSSEDILDALAESIEEIRHPDAICGIGLGVAGLIDPEPPCHRRAGPGRGITEKVRCPGVSRK
jgi:predicted NBD/HSP70 family sugar kinase